MSQFGKMGGNRTINMTMETATGNIACTRQGEHWRKKENTIMGITMENSAAILRTDNYIRIMSIMLGSGTENMLFTIKMEH